MVSSLSNNFNIMDTVSQTYTANSAAKLLKTTISEYIKSNQNKKVSANEIFNNIVNYNDDNAEKTISDILKDYTSNTSDYIKSITNKQANSLTKADYNSVGMGGYFDAQSALQMSKAIAAYSSNNYSGRSNTFNFKV